MKHLVAIAFTLWASSAHGGDAMIVKGELSFGSGGLAQVSECGTNRVFTLGVMASSPYFGLMQRYDEASANSKFTVLAEIEGLIARRASAKGQLVLDSPRVISLMRGSCADPPPNNSLSGRVKDKVPSPSSSARAAQHNRSAAL
jgi:hypothetical protein